MDNLREARAHGEPGGLDGRARARACLSTPVRSACSLDTDTHAHARARRVYSGRLNGGTGELEEDLRYARSSGLAGGADLTARERESAAFLLVGPDSEADVVSGWELADREFNRAVARSHDSSPVLQQSWVSVRRPVYFCLEPQQHRAAV
ncbi:hypothetical protein AOLI_G00284810 [Acnodon oligacanthus]